MTPFEKALHAAKEGRLKTPEVFIDNQGRIDYFQYQLANHKFVLNILSKGMTMRGVRLKDLKEYYGLKGRSSTDCFKEFQTIYENYNNNLTS